jgi:hypothetical protein
MIKFNEFSNINEELVGGKYTWMEAIKKVISENSDGLSASEIWNKIREKGLIKTKAKDPLNNVVYPLLQRHTDNIYDKRSGKSYFTSYGDPRFFKLSEESNGVEDDIEGEGESNIESEEGIKPFSSMFPTDFKGVQSQEESQEYAKNTFRQAICILGGSGAGKSYIIDEILESSNYEFIIPSASTTGLLSQFSPSAKDGRGGYIPSRLGKMIEKAYKNNNTLYTVVFDECHKSNIIEMINDELLQAISTGRNKNRFISLDDETSDLYPSKILDKRGNIEITDNLGFIFISSNARVISGNDDFFNRVDLVEITKESRDSVKTIEDLNKLRISDTDKKYVLVSKIMSESKR